MEAIKNTTLCKLQSGTQGLRPMGSNADPFLPTCSFSALLFTSHCSSEDSEPAAAKQAKPEKPVEVPWSEEDTDVVHLTENTFNEFIQTHSSALVMFYAPCKFASVCIGS